MKKFMAKNSCKRALVVCVLFSFFTIFFTACGTKSEKDQMISDLEAYGTFLDKMAEADTTDVSSYAMSVTAAVEEFDCSSEECVALKNDYQDMADALTTLATGMAKNDAAAESGESTDELTDDDTLLLEFQTSLAIIQDQASTDEQTLKDRAVDLGLEEEYKAAVGE